MIRFFVFLFTLFLVFTSFVSADIIPGNSEFYGNSSIHITPDRTQGSVEEVIFPSEFAQLNPLPPLPNKNIRIDAIYLAVAKGLEFTGANAGDDWWDVKTINISPDRQQIAVKVKGSWNPSRQIVDNWYCNSSVLFINYKAIGQKQCFMTFYLNGDWVMGYGINTAENAAIWQPTTVKLSPQPFEFAVKKSGKSSTTWASIKKGA